MLNGKNVIKTFECSFCGHTWECKRLKYKIRTLKLVGGKTWNIYSTSCPNCGRETTLREPKP